MRTLAITEAVIEALAGLALIAAPLLLLELLLGTPSETATDAMIGRVVGVGLLVLALGCWLVRNQGQSRAMRRMMVAMLLYNILAAGGLVAAFSQGKSGSGLWAGVVLHIVMGVWCLIGLLQQPTPAPAEEVSAEGMTAR